MSLAKKSNEVFESINELKALCIKEAIDENALKCMDPHKLEMIQMLLKIVNLTNDLMNEEMKAIDEINNKLDKLLAGQKD